MLWAEDAELKGTAGMCHGQHCQLQALKNHQCALKVMKLGKKDIWVLFLYLLASEHLGHTWVTFPTFLCNQEHSKCTWFKNMKAESLTYSHDSRCWGCPTNVRFGKSCGQPLVISNSIANKPGRLENPCIHLVVSSPCDFAKQGKNMPSDSWASRVNDR